ncbi:hypothetical protein WS98_15185 [Burkholderia territorii]|uniref:Uncharacterized protein n=2 Tax=Burkholderia cepacia complex TaxID=87882 RepID=A0A104D4M2_9BURK|nr:MULTISPECIES: hypothetical protein [Burkholderia cepacia complex]AOI59947.1 hypothetical protein WI26_20265 [Burkholderia diffusa]AOI62956.1 hypothetical protein WS51_04930 [Burkholderia territorii]KAB0675048.1 hypothetical protein F7R13_14810 [Burkholderia territorii]KUZ06919.1 hypothetical protein WI28_22590 [Burkholderia diffusa]KUZ28787.1 hypothetical protein WS52_26265 [Burkholderia territorii]
MKPLHLALVALSFTAAVAHAQTAPADVAQQPANRAEAVQAAGRVDRAQSKQEDPNACVGPVSFCNVYFGS